MYLYYGICTSILATKLSGKIKDSLKFLNDFKSKTFVAQKNKTSVKACLLIVVHIKCQNLCHSSMDKLVVQSPNPLLLNYI